MTADSVRAATQDSVNGLIKLFFLPSPPPPPPPPLTAGLAAHDLYDVIDFDSWYSMHLLQELEITEPRCSLCVGCGVWVWVWVGVREGVRVGGYRFVIKCD